MSRSPRIGAILVAVACTLAGASAASAATTITQTQITTPAISPDYLTYNFNTPNTFAVSGTTNSTAPGTDTVDLLCFYGDNNRSYTVATGVTLALNGSFSVPAAPLNDIESEQCRLRAVPTGMTSNDPAFAGPLLLVDEIHSYTVATGPNSGTLDDYYVYAQQTGGADDYDSIGSCGLDDSYLYDSAYGQTTTVFYCNAWLNYENLNGNSDTRSEIQVDGNDGYTPYGADAAFTGAGNNPGLPALTWSFGQDPTTGNATIHESDPIVRCNANTFPPTSGTCTSFSSTGVEVTRTINQTDSGHVVNISDSYSSTDGHAHALDLLYQNDQNLDTSSTNIVPSDIGYQFPGQTTYSAHAPGDTLSVPPGPGTIYVKDLASDDGDPYTGQGAIGYDVAPSGILFIPSPSSYENDFTMHYSATVPGSGALTYKFVYSTDYTTAEVRAEGLGAEDAFVSPTIKLTKPANGSVTHRSSAKITGTTTDLVGIASLTLNGKPVTVGAGGAFSVPVTLRSGANTFSAVARNEAGNSATASVKITYRPLVCKVPKLAGKKLSAAKTALKHANCATGKVSRKRSKTVKSGRVISSNPKAGGTHRAGTKVGLTVSSGK